MVCGVKGGHSPWDLLGDPEETRQKPVVWQELVHINDHVLIVVCTAVVCIKHLGPGFSITGHHEGHADPKPARKGLRRQFTQQLLVKDLICCLCNNESRVGDVEVIVGEELSRV